MIYIYNVSLSQLMFILCYQAFDTKIFLRNVLTSRCPDAEVLYLHNLCRGLNPPLFSVPLSALHFCTSSCAPFCNSISRLRRLSSSASLLSWIFWTASFGSERISRFSAADLATDTAFMSSLQEASCILYASRTILPSSFRKSTGTIDLSGQAREHRTKVIWAQVKRHIALSRNI